MDEINVRRLIISFLVICLAGFSKSLKCRTTQELQENNDLEYVVRMCLRRMNNETDFIDQFFRNQDGRGRQGSRNSDRNDDNSQRNHKHNYFGDSYNFNNNNNNNNNNQNNDYNNYNDNNDQNDYNKKSYENRFRGNQEKKHSDNFGTFWSFGDQHQPTDRTNYEDENQRKRDDEYNDEPGFFNSQKANKDRKNRYKSMSSSNQHGYQQQVHRDKETMQSHKSRDSSNYFTPSRKQNTNLIHFDKNRDSDSPLADIEPCVIHCIFQEMKMVDEDGKPKKELISFKMTQKIRNPELKNFIRESVEECFDSLDDYDFDSYRKTNGRRNFQWSPRGMCEWAKTFAICLENRGRENCEDWNDQNQNRSGNNGNTRNNGNDNKKNNSNNNSNNRNNENQRNKTKETG